MQFSTVSAVSNETESGNGQQRRQYTRSAQQRHYIKLWQQSNESVATFCKAHHIHPQTFDYWRKKHEALSSADKPTAPPPIPTASNDKNEKLLSSNENIKLHLPNRMCLSLPQATVSPTYLAKLLKELMS